MKKIQLWISFIVALCLFGCSTKMDTTAVLKTFSDPQASIRVIYPANDVLSSLPLNNRTALENSERFKSGQYTEEQKNAFIDEILAVHQKLVDNYASFFTTETFKEATKPSVLPMEDQIFGFETKVNDQTYYISIFKDGITKVQDAKKKVEQYIQLDDQQIKRLQTYFDEFGQQMKEVGLKQLQQ